MAEYIRRIVSGNKARFRDSKLHLELGHWQFPVKDDLKHFSPGIESRSSIHYRPSHHHGLPSRRDRRLVSQSKGGREKIPGASPRQELLGV